MFARPSILHAKRVACRRSAQLNVGLEASRRDECRRLGRGSGSRVLGDAELSCNSKRTFGFVGILLLGGSSSGASPPVITAASPPPRTPRPSTSSRSEPHRDPR